MTTRQPPQHRLVLGITGASGAIYAKLLINRLLEIQEQVEACGIIFSPYARQVWRYELEEDIPSNLPWPMYQPDDFFAPMASGSAAYRTMIICPATAGTLGRIAAGLANDLISRSADVVLKESGKLVLLLREAPFNMIHLKNMQTLAQAGAVICPASPSFYNKPRSLNEMAQALADRVLDLAGFSVPLFRWQEAEPKD